MNIKKYNCFCLIVTIHHLFIYLGALFQMQNIALLLLIVNYKNINNSRFDCIATKPTTILSIQYYSNLFKIFLRQ